MRTGSVARRAPVHNAKGGLEFADYKNRGLGSPDVELYFAAIRSMQTYPDRVNEVHAWTPAFTGRRGSSIEPIESRAQMER